jgi:hypothetical protein
VGRLARPIHATSNKLNGNAAEIAEVGVQRVALAGMDHARE